MEEKSRVVKVNLEFYRKSQVFSVFTLAFVLFIICVIVAATIAPNILDGKGLDYKQCKSSSDYFCFNPWQSNYAYFSVELSPHNQIFYLQLLFYSKAEINSELKYDLFIKTSENYRDESKYREENKTITIKCSDGECDSELLFYIPYIKYDKYIVDLRLYGSVPVDSMKFQVRYITKEFNDFFLGTKYFFLALSILALGHFAFHLYAVKLKYWTFESKLSGFMLLSLFIFNEPLLYFTLRKVTANWNAVSIYCNSQFIGLLIIFWFQMLHIEMNIVPKIIALAVEGSITIAFITFISVVYSLTVREQKINPTFSWESDLPSLATGIYIAGLLFLIILALMMLVHIILTLKNIKSYSRRNKIMLVFNYIMIFITFLFIGIGAFQPLPRSGTLLLTSISFFNIFLILLSWAYTPSRKDYQKMINEKTQEENDDLQRPRHPNNSSICENNKNFNREKQDELKKSKEINSTIIQEENKV